jgi:hypothetical protein
MQRLLLTVGLASAIAISYAPFDPARAGLFDFLNQGTPELGQRTIERPEPTDLPAILNPVAKSHAEAPRHITVVHHTQDKDAVLARQSAAFMKDSTLRDGDAVMTQNGIRIFAASVSDGHRANEFATLAETNGLSPAQRTALAEIDAQRSEAGGQSKSTGHDQLITGRSATTSDHPWKWVRDPKGQLVRYVGP